MDVRCPQCQTLYELDDEQVGKRAVTLKCSQCQHVFRLGGRAPTGEENQRRWMIRRIDAGDILYLNTFDTLHEWIMKRTVHEVDEISRTGNRWTALGEIAEFQPVFQVVESIAMLEGEIGPSSDVSSILTRRRDTPAANEAARQRPNRERIRTSIQFGGAGTPPAPSARTEDVTKKVRPTDIMPDEVAAEIEADLAVADARPPRPAMRGPLVTADISRERGEEPEPPPPSGVAIWLVGAGIVAAAIGAYLWLFQQEDFLRAEPDVVVIGETHGEPVQAAARPTAGVAIDIAVNRALDAASQENDAIWTMWHEMASRPFYIALDTAYAQADQASVGVELQQQLRNARSALENGKLEQASRAYRAVLAKEPRNAAAVSGLGWALLELGRAKEAAGQFQQSIGIDAEHGDAYIGLGSAHRQLGQLQDAYNAYDVYMGRFPRGPKASIASYQMKQLKKQLGM